MGTKLDEDTPVPAVDRRVGLGWGGGGSQCSPRVVRESFLEKALKDE